MVVVALNGVSTFIWGFFLLLFRAVRLFTSHFGCFSFFLSFFVVELSKTGDPPPEFTNHHAQGFSDLNRARAWQSKTELAALLDDLR